MHVIVLCLFCVIVLYACAILVFWYSYTVLLCPDSLVMCLSSQQSTNPLQLLAAQSAVGEAMERLWYGRYIASLTVEEKKKNEEETGETEQKQTKKSHICVEHTVQN